MERATFISRHVAERLTPPPWSVLVSIHDRSEPRIVPQSGWQDVLYLRFHDSDGSHLGLEHFSLEQGLETLRFVHKHLDAYELVVHCQMGVSRSAAVALFCAEVLGIPCFTSKDAATFTSHTAYNRRVLKLLWEAFEHPDSAGFRRAMGAD